MTAPPAIRTIAYLIQVQNAAGDWDNVGEFEFAKSRSVHTVANSVLHTRSKEHPGQRCRVLAWDVWAVQRSTDCDPFPQDGYPSTQFAWLSAMRENVTPHAEVTSAAAE
ncbi:hypothetical protein AB0K60_37135 [Thermopolyspora sp. NPDC052614]|uniref:hypothetical protein n=1 Tax=Thermopolyspora sp. NPDC052614 TaxID=3155682 RepID=UPI003438F328